MPRALSVARRIGLVAVVIVGFASAAYASLGDDVSSGISANWRITLDPPPSTNDGAWRLFSRPHGIDARDPWAANAAPIADDDVTYVDSFRHPLAFHRLRTVDMSDPWSSLGSPLGRAARAPAVAESSLDRLR
jgi:hypothetical protein